MADTVEDAPKTEAETEPQPSDKEDNGTPVVVADDVEKWKSLARKHEARAKENAQAALRLKEIEDSTKSDIQKATEAAQAAADRAAAAELKAMRYEVADAKNLPKKLMSFLTGTTPEELEASADALLEAIKPDTGTDTGKPKEALRSGAASTDAEPDKSREEILKLIPRA